MPAQGLQYQNLSSVIGDTAAMSAQSLDISGTSSGDQQEIKAFPWPETPENLYTRSWAPPPSLASTSASYGHLCIDRCHGLVSGMCTTPLKQLSSFTSYHSLALVVSKALPTTELTPALPGMFSKQQLPLLKWPYFGCFIVIAVGTTLT